jgi:hypothetical protein
MTAPELFLCGADNLPSTFSGGADFMLTSATTFLAFDLILVF